MKRKQTSKSQKRIDASHRAQELIYEAWEVSEQDRKIALAREALGIDPDCADAYVLLAEQASILQDQIELYQQGLQAGERALGAAGFEGYAGSFWGILETRGYMRARGGLAYSLWRLGSRKEALTHWRDMLKLNPNDNQGMRYVLAAKLLELKLDDELADLLTSYEGECGAFLLWTKALLAFRRSGDNPWSREALAEALESNQFVPDYLLKRKHLDDLISDDVGVGDASEAIWCVAETISAWENTNGSLDWLERRLAESGQ